MAVRSEVTSARRWAKAAIAGVVVIATSGVLTTAGTAQETPTLPAPTLSSTDFHVGDEITISGTGCLDPDTDSGEGLEILVYRTVDAGRGGGNAGNIGRIPVEADGTYEGSYTVTQPLPTRDGELTLGCIPEGGDQFGFDAFAWTTVAYTSTSPSLPDLTGTAGGTIDLTLPCSIEGGEYGYFSISLLREDAEPIYLHINGKFPYELSPDAGDAVQVPVPADTPPGTYPASAKCGIHESGDSALYGGFTVTITAGAPAPVAPAAPATPTEGTASYTG